MLEHKNGKRLWALLIVAGFFIGLGVGIALNKTAAGIMIGLGFGFLAAYIASATAKK